MRRSSSEPKGLLELDVVKVERPKAMTPTSCLMGLDGGFLPSWLIEMSD